MNDFDGLPLFGGSGGQPGQDQDSGELEGTHTLQVFKDPRTPPDELVDQAHGAGCCWLVCDPRRAGWAPGQDLGPYLAKAGVLFREKSWSGGSPPSVVRAHPTDAGNGTGTAAAALGLQVIADPKVGRGTFWLGPKGGGE